MIYYHRPADNAHIYSPLLALLILRTYALYDRKRTALAILLTTAIAGVTFAAVSQNFTTRLQYHLKKAL